MAGRGDAVKLKCGRALCGAGGLLATFPIDFQLDEEGHQQGV